MEAIINIEDRLRVIKSIFELCIEADVFPDEIFIYTIYQKWPATSNFRAEILGLNLSDSRNTKTVEVIYELSAEVLGLFNNILEIVGKSTRQFRYIIDCMPNYAMHERIYLTRKQIPKPLKPGKESSDEEIKNFNKSERFGGGMWYPWTGFNNEEKSDFIFAIPHSLADFAWRINSFLNQRFYNSKNAFEQPEKEFKSLTRARAFCIDKILNHAEHRTKRNSRKDIEELVRYEFPGQSAATIYESLRLAKSELDKEKHSKDFDYGMSLYRSKYPDS